MAYYIEFRSQTVIVLPQLIDQEKFTRYLYYVLLTHPERSFASALDSQHLELGSVGGLTQSSDTRTGEKVPLSIDVYPECARLAYTDHFCSIDSW